MPVGIRVLVGLVAIGAGLILAAQQSESRPEAPKGTASGPAFAVVELFTSEGCSSCPPADAALTKVAAEFAKRKQRVFALAFHVDYWDRLGWKDVYASPHYTARQRAYVVKLGLKTMYTPQMVVNGTREFVGSKTAKARAEIASALERSVTVGLTATVAQDAGAWTVAFTTKGAPPGLRVHGALVEGGLSSVVTRGENSGLTLAHAHVVRAFATADGASGRLVLRPGGPVAAGNARVVVYAQDPSTMAVVAATMAEGA
jgi:hypothetical protein